ncbi:hypothetical protein V8B97DRAFT_648494 [Scleroderma yunnanense]
MSRSNSLFSGLRVNIEGNIGRRLSTRHNTAVIDPGAERHIERLAEQRAAGVVRAHTRRELSWLHRPPLHPSRRGGKTHGKGDSEGDEKSDTDLGEVEEPLEKPSGQSRRKHLSHSDLDLATGMESDGMNVEQSHSLTKHKRNVKHGNKKANKSAPSWLYSFVNRTHPAGGLDRHDPESQEGPSGSIQAPHVHSRIGTGVLSTLLALYGNDHEHERVGEVSEEGSGESTPIPTSRASSGVGSEDEESKSPMRGWVDHPRADRDKCSKSTKLSSAGNPKDDPTKSSHSALGSSLKTSSTSSLLRISHLRTHSSPTLVPTAALIAGAGSLRSTAVPSGAALASDLGRENDLVRYEVRARSPAGSVKGDMPEMPAIVPTPSSLESYVPTSASAAGVSSSSLIPASPTETRPLAVKRGWKNALRDYPLPTSISRTGTPSTTAGTMGQWWKDISCSLPSTPRGGIGGWGWSALSGNTTPKTSGGATPIIGSEGGTPGCGVDEEGGKDYLEEKRDEREKRKLEKKRLDKERKKRERKEKKERRKRKKAEAWITRHVAAILQRQEFILKLARAMMMFGGPSHRLVAQIHSTGRVLDIELSCMYLPDMMLISFEDSATGTSNVKLIRQGSVLDLEKLGDAHALYWNVIHDTMSVLQASAALDALMCKKPLYSFTQLILIGGMCSASICSVSFSGSFIDSLASAPLGGLLVAVQLLSPRNELYGNVFEITIATLMSFVSAALASTEHFCYSAVASSSVVLILPGFIILCGSLELCSRSLVAGAVRLCFALMYSLFLGFGLAIGAEVYSKLVGKAIVGPTDYACVVSHDPAGPWWQRTPSLWWAFLTVPTFSLFLSMRLMAPWWKQELPILIAISCVGWVTNHFVGLKFPNQSDISAAVGAFAVGFVSNLYGRFFHGNAFVVMITGILFQVPSGLGNGGLLNFVSDQTSGSSSSYLSGFRTGLQLISVALGLTVGLGISLVMVHPVQSRRRAGGLFSL